MNQSDKINLGSASELKWDELLSAAYAIYRKRFWKLLQMGLPIALLTYLFAAVQHTGVHQLLAALYSRGLTRSSPAFWLLLDVVTFFTRATYWFLSILFFAAIAGYMLTNGATQAELISDNYSKVRQQLGRLLVVALMIGIPFFVGGTITNILVLLVLNRLKIHPEFFGAAVFYGIPLLMIAGLLSRMALAVPELMNNPATSIRSAIRGSIRKTENWEPFFIFFLAKSAIAGYAVYWLAEYAFRQLWQHTSINETVYSWVTWAVYICLFAALESPLFIAFSLLYNESELHRKRW